MLVLNQRPQPGQLGRRRGLPSSAAERVVQAWIDHAVEYLATMEHTCVLDDAPKRLTYTAIGKRLGLSRTGAEKSTARALVRIRIGLRKAGIDDE